MTGLEISCTTPLALPRWPFVEATPSATKEDATEEEGGPGYDSEPDGVTERGITASAVYPGFGQEKEGKVEDESDHSHSCGEARYAGAATRHGHFTDVCEETEHGRSGGQSECDGVEDEAVRYPFNDNIGKLDLRVISE